MPAIRYAIYYGIYGPLLGAGVLMLVIMPLTHGVGEQAGLWGYLGMIPAVLAMGIFIVPVALLFGMVPAIVTGLTHWWLNARTVMSEVPALAKAAIILIVGGIACVVFGVCLGAAVSDMLSAEVLGMFVSPGMAAGLGCALVAELRVSRLSADQIDS